MYHYKDHKMWFLITTRWKWAPWRSCPSSIRPLGQLVNLAPKLTLQTTDELTTPIMWVEFGAQAKIDEARNFQKFQQKCPPFSKQAGAVVNSGCTRRTAASTTKMKSAKWQSRKSYCHRLATRTFPTTSCWRWKIRERSRRTEWIQPCNWVRNRL